MISSSSAVVPSAQVSPARRAGFRLHWSPTNAVCPRRAMPSMPAERLVPVHAMRIYGDEASSLEFDAYGAGVPELAWIVEDAVLQDALWQGLEVDIFAPAQCDVLKIEPERASLRLREGGQIHAKLIVGADGANSFVRAQAGIAA